MDVIKKLEDEILACHKTIDMLSTKNMEQRAILHQLGAWEDPEGNWAYGKVRMEWINMVNGEKLYTTACKVKKSDRAYWLVASEEVEGEG